ncbi:winged helix-turn-helix domain-containing protein [Candidatus Methylomirabilis sp.]|uniref:winged helix-turn-helix domain-containing protein n=1 Tax=Candidatus Methylomirabilis sp. TaxID=2032687 RepID=UPI003C71DC6A
MSEELRIKLLYLLEEHSKTGSNEYKPDSDLANELGVSTQDVQKQLDILETQELIKSANTFGGHNAIISPKGSLVIEQINEQEKQPKKGPIGFRPEADEK